MNNKELYKISKYVYTESFLQSHLDMSGASVSSVKEKMEKNKKYIRNQVIFTKIIMVLCVSFLILIVVIDLAISVLITIGFVIIVTSKSLIEFTLIIFPIELVLALSLYFVYNRMFPKPKKSIEIL